MENDEARNRIGSDPQSTDEVGFHLSGKNGENKDVFGEDVIMDISTEDQVKEAFIQSQLIDKKLETVLKYFQNTNPVERILKTIDPTDEELRKTTKENVSLMMVTWLGSYAEVLKAGKELPVDLIGEAADLARKMRKRNNSE